MGYRIYDQKEKEEFLKINKKDIIISSIECALAIATTYGIVSLGNNLSKLDIIGRIAAICCVIGTMGLNFHALIDLIIRVLDRYSIEETNTTNLYNQKDLKKVR